jgi:hypothetical protein
VHTGYPTAFTIVLTGSRLFTVTCSIREAPTLGTTSQLVGRIRCRHNSAPGTHPGPGDDSEEAGRSRDIRSDGSIHPYSPVGANRSSIPDLGTQPPDPGTRAVFGIVRLAGLRDRPYGRGPPNDCEELWGSRSGGAVSQLPQPPSGPGRSRTRPGPYMPGEATSAGRNADIGRSSRNAASSLPLSAVGCGSATSSSSAQPWHTP